MRGGSFFQFSKIILHFSAVCLQLFKKNLHLSHILALPTWGQKCLVSEIEQIEKVNFDLGHPEVEKKEKENKSSQKESIKKIPPMVRVLIYLFGYALDSRSERTM